MTAPFNRAKPARAALEGARSTARGARRRAPGLALALAGAAIGILGAASGLPVLAEATAGNRAADGTAAPLRCEITLDALRGSTGIAGTVYSDRRPVTGEYRMAITSRSAGGSATIRQSGAFQAGPGQPAILGETRLMGGPASQDVDLTVTIDGARLPCATAGL